MSDEYDLDKEIANHGRNQAKKQVCPHCGASNAVVIIYGRTTPEIAAKRNELYEGEWAGGGCFFEEEDFYCQNCKRCFQGDSEPFPGLFG